MSEYGLPGVRDKDGELQAVEHSFDWNDDEVTIELVPPTISEFESYEDMGDDVAPSELQEIVDEHLTKPKIQGDLTAPELLCYANGIIDYCQGGAGGLAEEVREEIEQREGASGN